VESSGQRRELARALAVIVRATGAPGVRNLNVSR
jgi:hypothetical protein